MESTTMTVDTGVEFAALTADVSLPCETEFHDHRAGNAPASWVVTVRCPAHPADGSAKGLICTPCLTVLHDSRRYAVVLDTPSGRHVVRPARAALERIEPL